MPPTSSRSKKRFIDTTSKKIDSYFKPMNKTKRKIENDENCQENERPSPSPPNSQQLKTFGGLKSDTTTSSQKPFGLKSDTTSSFQKSFGLKADKENIGSSGLSRKDRENNGCKTFGTTNALMWQKFDRQPLREKSIKPVNILKLNTTTTHKPKFNVLSDKEIENGIEDSLGSLKRTEEGELNTQFIEESDTFDSSNYTIKSPPILSYHSENEDIFKPYTDQDQVSDTASEDRTHSDEFDTQDNVYFSHDDDDDDDNDAESVINDSQNSKDFKVYVDEDSQEKIDVYQDDDDDDDDANDFKVYVDNDAPNTKIQVYIDPELRKEVPDTTECKKLPPTLTQSACSAPDFFSDDEDKEDSGSTFGSKGVFDDEEEFSCRSIPAETEEFSITNESVDSLGPTPEFKEPIAPIFSSNYKQLLRNRNQAS